MTEQYQPIADLLDRVRSRWRRLVAFRATTRAALVAAAAVAVVLLLAQLTNGAPVALAALGVIAVGLVVTAFVWGLRPLRETPSDARIARFIEERKTELDERLVSAVGVARSNELDTPSVLAHSMIGDAARAASTIDPAEIVASEILRRAGFQAAAAVLLMIALIFMARERARQSFDALALALFPSQIVLEVTPGDARVEAGSSLTVTARLVGNRAPVVAELLRVEGDGDDWKPSQMSSGNGAFTLSLNALATPFRYRVVAGAVSSKTFSVAVVRAPRVRRIDVEYIYPKGLGLPPRVEEDGGDIYAPAGTDVRIKIETDRPAASGQMMLGGDKAIALSVAGEHALVGSLQILEDNSYRVALSDAEGLTSRGDTEYFIRTLEDRPPEVHVTRPASDRRVTRLEEVDIEAEAEDDFGVVSLDLVYAVRGGTEKVVPLRIPSRATSVTGRHTIYLEDLDVRPGDFVTYYVRARDLARGKPSSETRSDIFFLDVKPFEEEFTLAQTQAAMGGGQPTQQIDELVAAQKQVIVATWKLDRRSKAAKGAKSDEDIRSVSRAEGELKVRVEQASSAFRQSTMRDPRGRAGRGAAPSPPAPRAGQTLQEEDAMTAAANAMGKAVTSLDALKTSDAIPPEMEALNNLLKAQADIKQRQVQQQAGAGGGGNRSTQDMSSLFDKELARHQQTNYETPKNATDQKQDENEKALDKIKELARRQDELLKKQQDLARDRERLSPEELKRQLESLTRDQNELRQKAEELAQEMARQKGQDGQERQDGQQGQDKQAGQAQQPGQTQGNQTGQPGQQAGQGGQPGQDGQRRPGESGQSQGQNAQKAGPNGQQMRDISEEMRNAANDLRRQDSEQASARSARALDKLRDLERQIEASTPDGRRRALGDLQLEARQLADAERQIASESGRARQGQSGEAGKDSLRRLAGEQQRLADRLQRVEDRLKQQGESAAGAAGKDAADAKALQQAAADAARELDRQRLAERMQQSAESMRAAAGQSQGETKGQSASASASAGKDATATPSAEGTPQAQEEVARALDRLADKLASADRAGNDDESRKLSGQLAKTQELRERLDELSRQIDQLNQQANQQAANQPNGRSGNQQAGQNSPTPAPGAPSDNGKPGQGQSGSGSNSADVERVREQMNREMRNVRELLDQTRREENKNAQGGAGLTFEGQGMTLSAPGTEAFKQDYSKWQEMKRQVNAALEQVESTLAKKLQDKAAKDRLATGADDKAPAAYQQQVDSYFKALATRKRH